MFQAIRVVRASQEVLEAVREIAVANAVTNTENSWTVVSLVTSLDSEPLKTFMQTQMEDPPCSQCDDFFSDVKQSKEYDLALQSSLADTQPTAES